MKGATDSDRRESSVPKVKGLSGTHDSQGSLCVAPAGRSLNPGGGRYCCEGHHLRPLGRDHNGSDDVSNVVILCPNHHAEFDYFLFAILDFTGKNRAVEHMYRILGRNERSITIKHRIARENLDYVIEQFLTRLDLYFSN